MRSSMFIEMAERVPQTTVTPRPVRHRKARKPQERKEYYNLRASGISRAAAIESCGISVPTARRWDQAWLESGNASFDKAPETRDPKVRDQMTNAARKGLSDFNYFQERYLGRVSLPWQKTAAETLLRLAKSPEKEFVVANMPPGAGKSTLFTHDIVCWMIAKNRGIRICIISSTQSNAEKFADRVRRSLEATTPIKAPEKELRLGIAKDAEATLARDYGRFRAEEVGARTWSKGKFFVERPAGDESHKDATVEAFGVDQAKLGGRFDVVICDDYYDPSKTRTFEAKELLKNDFADVVESRLEPSGLLVVVMQRVDPEDLSRYCLDMEAYDAENDEDINQEELAELQKEKRQLKIDPLPVRDGTVRKYRHLIYKAHFEENCEGPAFHKLSSPAYPDGCLLYPRRLSYRDLKTKEKNDPGKFKIWYQQEDIDLANVLVDPTWIKGGKDEFGIERPGCLDQERSVRQIPRGLTSDIFSFVTVDPSPSNFWGIIWWAYHKPSNELFLIDLVRQQLKSAGFFDMNPNTGDVSGVLVDMVDTAREIGIPLRYVVAEVNAAQRFMYDQSPITQYLRMNSIALMPHTTTAQNKNSTEFGVQTLQSWFRDGRIRLPMKQTDFLNSRTRSLKLIDEVTRYRLDGTTSYTDDLVMSTWFGIRATEKLYRERRPLPQQFRPSWMTGRPGLKLVG